jgi:hypothetical protein
MLGFIASMKLDDFLIKQSSVVSIKIDIVLLLSGFQLVIWLTVLGKRFYISFGIAV